MKTEFLKGLGLDEDIIAKIQAESGKDVAAEKDKASNLKKQLDDEQKARKTLESKVAELEKVDADGLNKEIADLKKQISDRKAQDDAAAADKALRSRFKGVSGEAKFINDITEKGIYAEFKDAVSKDENKGKGDKEIYEDLVKDRDGIFAPKNQGADIPPTNPNAQAPEGSAGEFAKIIEQSKLRK